MIMVETRKGRFHRLAGACGAALIFLASLLLPPVQAQTSVARHDGHEHNGNTPLPIPKHGARCRLMVEKDGQSQLDYGCLIAMAFNPKVYFDSDARTDHDPLLPNGFADAVLVQRNPVWAFAISDRYPCFIGGDAPCKPGEDQLLLRAVTWKRPSERATEPSAESVNSRKAMRAYADSVLDWREADLRACPKALEAFLALEEVQWQPFGYAELAQAAGLLEKAKDAENIIVASDYHPETFVVRVREKNADPAVAVAVRDGGEVGGAGAWAKKMLAVAEPCLKPTAAPAPWNVRHQPP
jgi:hypothetical protein